MKIGNTTGIESEFAIALCVIRRAGPASSSLEFDLDKGGDLSVTGRQTGFGRHSQEISFESCEKWGQTRLEFSWNYEEKSGSIAKLPRNFEWSRLMARVFEFDVLKCPEGMVDWKFLLRSLHTSDRTGSSRTCI